MSRPADPNAKEALVAAARAEFARKGLRGARVEDITAACGLSKGAFYLHFETKEGLFKTLVDELMAELGGCAVSRVTSMQAFLEQHGPLTGADMTKGTQRLRAFTELECVEDERTLEAMWKYRDVLDVLLSGSQGTPFERTVWEMIDQEQARIAENHRQFQAAGACRSDIPAELFGAMIIGTYLLVGKQMARANGKPDLAALARALHKLIREGSGLRDEPAAAASIPKKKPAAHNARSTRARKIK